MRTGTTTRVAAAVLAVAAVAGCTHPPADPRARATGPGADTGTSHAASTPRALPRRADASPSPVRTATATTPAPDGLVRAVDRRAPACEASALELSSETWEGGTGRHPVLLVLRNVGDRVCNLTGTPNVTLPDATGAPLPFDYERDGQHAALGATVTVAVGAAAYVRVDKYRCDVGSIGMAEAVRVELPTSRGTALTAPLARPLAHCGAGDPGSIVLVTPFLADTAELLPR